MDLFTYLMAKNNQNTHKDLFSYLLGKNAGGSGTYTTFSGTSLNISNTIKAKIKNFMLNSTELTQDGTPTPDNPVDVNVIKGENNVKVENKNLALNDDANNPDTNYESSGAGSAAIQYDTTEQGFYTTTSRARFFKLEEGKTYVFSVYGKYRTTGNAHYIYYYYFNSTTEEETAVQGSISVSQSDSYNRYSKTFTIPNGYDGFKIIVFNGLYFKDIQLEQNSTATEYVEHQEQNYPISLSSKNLLNVPSTFTFKATYPIDTELEVGNYTLSWSSVFTDSTNTRANIIMRYEDGTSSGNNFVNFTSTSMSLNPTKKVNRIYFYSSISGPTSADITITYENLMLEQDSTATEYEPYHEPIEYCKIGDYKDQISNQFESKNSFNIDDFVTKMSIPFNATNQDGVVNITRKSATTYDYPLNCKENTQYTLSMDFLNTASGNYYIRFKYSDGTYSDIVNLEGYNDFTKITATSTTNKTLTSINFQLYGYNNNIQMKNIQLEEGNTATSYEPYYNIEYCKIGDYADQIFKNTTDSPYYDSTLLENEWYLKKNIGKIVLNGSEDWTQTQDTSVSNFYIRVANEIVAYGTSGTGKSNYFKYIYANSAGNFYFSSATRLILSMENTYTLETFKTWLLTHNTNVYYPLATPTYIHISESDYPTLKAQLENLYNNAKSYNGQTNITQTNADLPFNISVDVKVANL